MDPLQVAKEVGGGLNGIVIVALGMVCVALWLRLNKVTDLRFEDQKRHTSEILLTTDTIKEANTLVRELLSRG